MQSKILSKRGLLIAVLTGFVLAPALLYYLRPTRTIQSRPAALIVNAASRPKAVLPKQEQASGWPVRFKIPKLNINAAVESVSLAPDGSMDTPKNLANVAWFESGQRPGDN